MDKLDREDGRGARHPSLEDVWDAAALTGVAALQSADGDLWLSPSDSAPDGQFLIYSVTKIVVAIIYLRCADKGLIGLDDPVSEQLPVDLPAAVTLRRLLNHTAGIPDYGHLAGYHEAVRSHPSTPWSDEEFLSRALQDGLRFEPGRRFEYSNTGYLLLRCLLDRVTAGGFAAAVREHLIEPLGLQRTFLPETPEDLMTLVPGSSHLLGPKQIDVRGVYHPHWVGHRVLASTVHDLITIADALTSGRLLSAERLDEMLTGVDVSVDSDPSTRPRYGLGVMMEQPDGDRIVVGHLGGGPGYGAALYQSYETGRGERSVAVLSNRDGGSEVRSVALALLTAAAG